MRPFRSVSFLRLFAIGLVLTLPPAADAARRKPHPTHRVENCVISLESLHVFIAKTITYAGRCPGGLAEGVLSVTGHSSDPNDAYTITSTFVRGRPTGRTIIVRPDRTTYTGTIDLAGNSTATVNYADGSVDQFEFRGTVLWRGVSTDPILDPATRYYLRSHEVPVSMYQADLEGHPPPEALFRSGLTANCIAITFSRGKPATQRASCNGAPLSGYNVVSFVSTDGRQADLVANFTNGRPSGVGRIGYSGTAIFLGTIAGFSRSEGVTVDSVRGIERGTYQNDRLYDGSFVPQGSTLATIVLRYRHGKLLGPSEAAQRVLLARIPQGAPMPRMARLNIDGSTCYANLPTNEYKISAAEMPGQCRDGYYSGRARFTLTPLRGGLSTQTVSIAFDRGLPTGEARVSFANNQSFIGTLSNWRPASGQISQALGGDNYEVLAIADGAVTSRRQEHRQPSEGEIAGRQILGALLRGMTRCMQGGCGGSDQNASPSYQPTVTQRAAVPSSPQSGPQARANCVIIMPNGGYSGSNDPTVCAAEAEKNRQREAQYQRNSGASTRATIARADTPLPVPTTASLPMPQNGNAEPATSSGSRQYAICNYNTADGRQLTSTDPTVCTTVARQQQNGEPVIGVPGGPATAAQSTGSRQYAICNYYTADGQYRTSTDPAVCTAAAQEAPNTPRPAATQPVAIPASTPANQPTNTTPASYHTASSGTSSGAIPGMPSSASPGSYSQSGAPNVGSNITLTWLTSGASYYEFGIKDMNSGLLVVDTQVTGDSYYANLPSGKYRWNVAACNSTHRCSAYTTPLYFNVGNTQASPTSSSSASTQSASLPAVPTGLYPTNQGELKQPIPLGWGAVSGATRFRLAVHDRTDGTFPVDDQYVTDNPHYVTSLKPGHQFAWDVMACNSAGCSGRSDNMSFRTAAATVAGPVGLSESQCIINAHMPSAGNAVSRRTLAGWVASNAAEGAEHRGGLNWFKDQVNEHRRWDYKTRGSVYADFGNYNYGYVGSSVGISQTYLLRAAGAVQFLVDISQGRLTGSGIPAATSPYGDQILDQIQIINGSNDYNLCHRN